MSQVADDVYNELVASQGSDPENWNATKAMRPPAFHQCEIMLTRPRLGPRVNNSRGSLPRRSSTTPPKPCSFWNPQAKLVMTPSVIAHAVFYVRDVLPLCST